MSVPLPTLGLLVMAILTGLLAVLWLLRGDASRSPRLSSRPAPHEPLAPRQASPSPTLGDIVLTAPPPPLASPHPTPGRARQDQATYRRLRFKLIERRIVTAADVLEGERLYKARPADERLRDLLVELLVRWSQNLQRQRRNELATEALRRAISLRPDRADGHIGLARLLASSGDWPGAEQEARAALAIEEGNPDALAMLGQALWRLGRDREAIQALEAAIERGESRTARPLLERIQKEMRDERGMKNQELASFSVRYDGEAHEDIGREVLRVLDRHFATLVVTFDHRPSAPVPVILFTRQAYYQATSAPAWSGGLFDNIDGRIRIPVGGLTATELTSELDGTLLHELSHAFVADISRGTAPRQIHEGLAQYMEGKRLEELLSENQLRLLADGRIGGVPGLYMNALALGEYLMDLRGQGGINDLLREMGTTRSVDEACGRVYGQTFRELLAATKAQLKQRHGS